MAIGASIINYVRAFGEAAGLKIDSIKINTISVERKQGKAVVVKRRNTGCETIAAVANLFFRLVEAPIRVWVDTQKWQRYETDCFRLLNGDRYRVWATGLRTVRADKVPGKNLRAMLKEGTLNEHVLEIAARELRRAHQLWCGQLDATWSHGDLQMSNIVYDRATDSARIIDFETMHDSSLPAVARRADDLLVFLQDMMWRLPRKRWVPFAMAFIRAYGRSDVTDALGENLYVPGGAAGLWWKIRANHFVHADLVARVADLKEALDTKALPTRHPLPVRRVRPFATALTGDLS